MTAGVENGGGVTPRRIRHQPGMARLAAAIEAEAAALGTRALLVGGYVRDRLLERDVKDVDVVVENGLGTEVAEAVGRRLEVRPPVVFERFGTSQLAAGDFTLEFVSARAESYRPHSRKPDVVPASLEEDTRRRDFTVNALHANAAGDVLDLTGMGLADLDARLLRTPLPAMETFAEDPLRAVRAVRFAVGLDFALHEDIPPAIRANLERIRTVVSVERVNEELRRMLLGPRPGGAVRLLWETGIAAELLPEVSAMAGVEQSGFHHLDVLQHTLEALDRVAFRPAPHLSPAAELRLRLALLMHDAGKPATAQRDGERITFLGHPELGARLAGDMMRRLRFSNDEAADVARLVTLHMRPIQYSPDWSDGAIRRLDRDSGELLPALLELTAADMAASRYPPAEAGAKLGDLRRRLATVDVAASRGVQPSLDGHALMARFGRPPGPWIAAVQHALVEAILDGHLEPGNPEAAWRYLDQHPELVPA